MKKYFCSDKSWHEIIRASQLFKFQGLMGHVKDNLEDWHRFYDTADPLQAEWREKIRFGRIDFLDAISISTVGSVTHVTSHVMLHDVERV